MNRTIRWRFTYGALALLATLLLVGQWGAGVTTLALSIALAQLVRIGDHLELLTASLQGEGDPGSAP